MNFYKNMSEKLNRNFDFINEEQGVIENKEKSKIIVEIGHGGHPVYQKDYYKDWDFKKDINKNEHYIGIDLLDSTSEVVKSNFPKLSADILKKIIEQDKKRENVKGKIDFIIGSGENLPLLDESVDHMIFKDVFGFSFGKEYYEYSGQMEIRRNLINESIRVLKEGGELEIIEGYSPEIASEIILAILENKKYNSRLDLDKFISIETDRNKNQTRYVEKEINKEELLFEIKSDREGTDLERTYFKNGKFMWNKPYRIIFKKKGKDLNSNRKNRF